MQVVLVAMMLSSRDSPALAYVGPNKVLAFAIRSRPKSKDGAYYRQWRS